MKHLVGVMDCNNFFVSCERLFRPDLVEKPVAVLSSNDGCIVARSNEVKDMGIPMGIPLFQAKQLVDMRPVTLFSSNFTLYRDLSRRVMAMLAAEVGACEVYSVDEAFFTVPVAITEAELHALRTHISKTTGIPVSIGVGATKTIAKVAVEQEKRGSGVCLLRDDDWRAVAADYACHEVWNIGRATAAALREVDITTVAELLAADRSWVAKRFGVAGCRLYDELSAVSVHQVTPNSDDIRQSLTSSRSFAESTSQLSELESALSYHVVEVAKKLRQQRLLTDRLIIIARPSRHGDFAYQRGSFEVPLLRPSNVTSELLSAALAGLRANFDSRVPYKKAGVVAGGLVPESFRQVGLFDQAVEQHRTAGQRVDSITDRLNTRFGAGTIRPAVILASGTKVSAKLRSPSYTTVWKDIPTVQAG